MVKLIRLDERLIHGQIAIKWSRLLGVDRIIVADDEAAQNEIMQKTLLMAAPSNVKVAIVEPARAIALCNDERSRALSILLIVSNPSTLLEVVEGLDEKPKVNVGNYGRVAPKNDGATRKMLTSNLYADEQEAAVLKKVTETGADCSVQVIPDDAPKDLSAVLGL